MGLFSWIFGKPLTAQQLARANLRAIKKAIRSVEREKYNMELQEKKFIQEIKKAASIPGQMDICEIIAKDIVRTRQYIKQFMRMKANLQAVSIRIVTLQSQQAIGDAVRGITIALRAINHQMQLPQVQHILKEFEKQTVVMDTKESLINESVDNAFDGEDPELESEELVTQVLDELGLQLKTQLPELPNQSSHSQKKATVESPATNIEDDDILERLKNLRKD